MEGLLYVHCFSQSTVFKLLYMAVAAVLKVHYIYSLLGISSASSNERATNLLCIALVLIKHFYMLPCLCLTRALPFSMGRLSLIGHGQCGWSCRGQSCVSVLTSFFQKPLLRGTVCHSCSLTKANPVMVNFAVPCSLRRVLSYGDM